MSSQIETVLYLKPDQLRLNEVFLNLTTALEKPQQKPTESSTIYFDVYLSSTQRSSGVVKFNKFRDSSSMSGFEISSGKFICPFDGVYFFHFYFISDRDGSIAPGIVVDGTTKCRADAKESSRTHSCAIVTKLTKGQSVYVSHGDSEGIYYGEWSGFLGYLI